MKNVVVELNLSDSSFVSRDLIAYIIEEFQNLDSICISDCPRITVDDLINVFSEFRDLHNENSTGGSEYRGKKLTLAELDL
jgi:hypothetical protein